MGTPVPRPNGSIIGRSHDIPDRSLSLILASSPNGQSADDRRDQRAAKGGKKHVGGENASRGNWNTRQRGLGEAIAVIRAEAGYGLNPIVGNAGENKTDR